MFQSVRGMQDHLPSTTAYWAQLETHLKQLVKSYGYQEIRFPIVEKTELFQHSIGSVTDIVEKEMYHLRNESKGGSLSLRPEGTASCVRAAIEHQLLVKSLPQRLWYIGPMFRRERPQKGRYRQFYQFGVEVFGISQPEIDAEVIAMTQRLWKTLGIDENIRLEINSLGSYETRQQYRTELVNYFTARFDELDEDSKRRLKTNPLRILDSKNPAMIAINENAPQLLEYLDERSRAHFTQLQSLLNALNIPFHINPRLVRGLDYYNRTVFEWVIKTKTGAQNTVCGGGRYDGLVKQLKGPDRPAIGFSIGLERLLDLWLGEQPAPISKHGPELYIIQSGEQAILKAPPLEKNCLRYLRCAMFSTQPLFQNT